MSQHPSASSPSERVFRLVERPLWIVTAADGARRGGLLASWVYQASLDPQRPMVLAGLASNHFTAELVEASGCLALHLIGAGQIELAWRFGLGSGREVDKLAGLAWREGQTGAPLLADCLAWLEARVLTTLDSGDRRYVFADVVAGDGAEQGQPLTDAELFASASEAQRAQLLAQLQADVAAQRPRHDAWRRTLG